MSRLSAIWKAFQLACTVTVIVTLPTGIIHAYITTMAERDNRIFWRMILFGYCMALIIATVYAIVIERGKE